MDWKNIRNLMIDAAGDLQKLQINNDLAAHENTRLMSSNTDITRELKIDNEEIIRDRENDREISRRSDNSAKISFYKELEINLTQLPVYQNGILRLLLRTISPFGPESRDSLGF